MSLQPRRSRRLRDTEEITARTSVATFVKNAKISRKRKRAELSDPYIKSYELPRKKRKYLHNFVPESWTIQSKLFSHVLDQERFRDIFDAILQSPLGQMMNLPSVIMAEISEYANGSLKKCHNYKDCNQTILTLHEYNVICDFALERAANQIKGSKYLQIAAENVKDKTNYFRYLPHYFCMQCIKTGLRICSVCNTNATTNYSTCNCGHTLIYCRKCIKHCSYCNHMQVCHKNDDTKPMFDSLNCHRIIKCTLCKSKMCTGNKKAKRKKVCRDCRKQKRNRH